MSFESSLVSSLDDSQRTLWATLAARLVPVVERLDDEVLRFVFPAARTRHPFDDAREVLFHAAGQLAPRCPSTGEFPLLFIGYSALNRVTRSREAIGFLLTQRAIHVRETPSGVLGRDAPRVVVLFLGEEGIPVATRAIVDSATSRFDWEWAEDLADDGVRRAATQALVDAVATTLAAADHLDLGIPATAPTTTNARERVAELGIGGLVRFATDAEHAKHLRRLAKKLDLQDDETLLLAVSDATLMGPYGLAVTDRAVHSRDLMEAPARTGRTGLDPLGTVVADHRVQLSDGASHVIPSHLDDRQQSRLQRFLREYLDGGLG